MKIVVIGAGAAGFFGAVIAKSLISDSEVLLLEKTRQPLAKVKVSGGGRCNVTHYCFEVPTLIKGYPRGNLELRGAFHRFQPKDMIQWLQERGVQLKAEEDGRMFPVTNSSQTIIECFRHEAEKLGVQLLLGTEVVRIERADSLKVVLATGEILEADKVLIATGSVQKAYPWIEALGHTIVAPVPSLFTFTIEDPLLEGLSGVSVPDAAVQVEGLRQRGPVLITHWGLSGPAVLKLSAWAARKLATTGYCAHVEINWIPEHSDESFREILQDRRIRTPRQQVCSESLGGLPRQLWKKITESAGIPNERIYAQLSKEESHRLMDKVLRCRFTTKGKSTYKEEFVTCGGVSLDEIDFRRMESKKCPGVHFAGEVLDIDGITGGYNFQSAWTTSWISAHAMAEG